LVFKNSTIVIISGGKDFDWTFGCDNQLDKLCYEYPLRVNRRIDPPFEYEQGRFTVSKLSEIVP
jgi:hypothetical protein